MGGNTTMKPLSKDDLQPRRQKSESTIGPGYDGKHRHFAKPGEPSLIAHPHALPNAAGMVDHTRVPMTLGKQPLPKNAWTPPPIHSGMMAKSRKDGTHFSGVSGPDIARYDADGPDPLAGPPQGKRTARAEINPGCRDRSGDSLASEDAGVAAARAKAKGFEAMQALGRAILNEAAAGSAPDDRRALGIGTLPGSTTE